MFTVKYKPEQRVSAGLPGKDEDNNFVIKRHRHQGSSNRLIKVSSGEDWTYVRHPIKSDYPVATTVHDVELDVSSASPDIPTRTTTSVPWNGRATTMSARSKRELRQMLSAGGGLVLSNIQVNEHGHYFVYNTIAGPPPL